MARSPTISGTGDKANPRRVQFNMGLIISLLIGDGVKVLDAGRVSSRMLGPRGNSLVDKIHRQREEEENARKAWEEVYDVGLIGLGVIVDGAVNVVLNTMPEGDE